MSSEANPFCTRFIQPGAILFVFNDDHSAESLFEEIARTRRSLIVGPHGTGKSTLIQTLMPRLTERFANIELVQLHVAESDRFADRLRHTRNNGQHVRQIVTSSPAGTLVIVDGIEQLTRVDRWRLKRLATRKNRFILATSHRNLAGFQTLYRTEVSRPLVEYLCQRLLQSCNAPTAEVVLDAIREREITPRTNVRNLWFDLYDVVAVAE